MSALDIDAALADELTVFVARVREAADDPSVSEADLVDLIFGDTNPLLLRGVVPGKALVTREIFDDPTFQQLLTLLQQKRAAPHEPSPAHRPTRS